MRKLIGGLLFLCGLFVLLFGIFAIAGWVGDPEKDTGTLVFIIVMLALGLFLMRGGRRVYRSRPSVAPEVHQRPPVEAPPVETLMPEQCRLPDMTSLPVESAGLVEALQIGRAHV